MNNTTSRHKLPSPTHSAALCALASSLLCLNTASAALVVTGGDFESQSIGTADNSVSQNVGDWFDSSANWSSYTYRHATQLLTTSQVFGTEVDGGWIYQSLGTRSVGEDSISFNFDAIERDRGGYGWDGKGLTIDLYSGSFTGADGTDIDATLTSFDTIAISPGDIFVTPVLNEGANRETINYTTSSIDLTGVTLGDQVWVRLGASGAKAAYIDNFAVVPEPSSFALLAGCFGLTWVMLRRRG